MASLTLPACVTYESSLQTGRSLSPGRSSHGLALHYLVDHDRNVLPERLRGNESNDYGLATRHTGLSYHYRRNIVKGFDGSLGLSFGSSSVGLHANLVNLPRLAIGLNPKWLFPSFSIDIPPTYRGGLLLPISYDLLPDASVVVTPAVYSKPWGDDRHRITAVHSGLLLGRERGVFFEWSFYQETFATSLVESKEQFKIALLSQLDGYDRPAPTWDAGILTKLRPTVAYEYSSLLQIGLRADLHLPRWLPQQWWVSAGLPYREQELDGYAVFWRSRYGGGQYQVASGLSEDTVVNFGLGYRQLIADIATNLGYQYRSVGVPVVTGGLRWQRESYDLRFLEVYLPLPFLYRHVVESGVESDISAGITGRMAHQPTIFLVGVDAQAS